MSWSEQREELIERQPSLLDDRSHSAGRDVIRAMHRDNHLGARHLRLSHDMVAPAHANDFEAASLQSLDDPTSVEAGELSSAHIMPLAGSLRFGQAERHRPGFRHLRRVAPQAQVRWPRAPCATLLLQFLHTLRLREARGPGPYSRPRVLAEG